MVKFFFFNMTLFITVIVQIKKKCQWSAHCNSG